MYIHSRQCVCIQLRLAESPRISAYIHVTRHINMYSKKLEISSPSPEKCVLSQPSTTAGPSTRKNIKIKRPAKVNDGINLSITWLSESR